MYRCEASQEPDLKEVLDSSLQLGQSLLFSDKN